MTKFLRRSVDRYSKLGKRRKKKQKWKRPTGRDNKMREKRRGYPIVVSIGHGKDTKKRGLLKGKIPLIVNNIKDLMKIKEKNIGIIGNIGKKNKIEVVAKAKEMKLSLFNINFKTFLKKNKIKKKQEAKPLASSSKSQKDSEQNSGLAPETKKVSGTKEAKTKPSKDKKWI